MSALRHKMRELLLGTEVMYCGNCVGGVRKGKGVKLHVFLTSVPDDGI
jgi:hypothetical protein